METNQPQTSMGIPGNQFPGFSGKIISIPPRPVFTVNSSEGEFIKVDFSKMPVDVLISVIKSSGISIDALEEIIKEKKEGKNE